MKRFLTSSAACVLAATFAFGTAATAQPYGHAYGYYNHHRDRDDYRRGDYYRSYHHGYYRPTAYRGWHDQSDWRRGGYVARYDWDRGYAVDYRRYHLRRPPYGYEWRRVGDNYVLAAVASGLIADMIINSR